MYARCNLPVMHSRRLLPLLRRTADDAQLVEDADLAARAHHMAALVAHAAGRQAERGASAGEVRRLVTARAAQAAM